MMEAIMQQRASEGSDGGPDIVVPPEGNVLVFFD
jgi:hypothetical protein